MPKKAKLHELPGLMLNDPMIKPFRVVDNNGNWLIERSLIRWVRMDKAHAEEDAKLLNVGYQLAMLDLLAKLPEAIKNQAVLKDWKDKVEKQMTGINFED